MLAFATGIDSEFWARWLGIVVLDLLLAGDNALVIALAVQHLPPREQRRGRIWGTALAVALRLLCIGGVSYLLAIPLLQALGGVLLLWVAWRLLRQPAARALPPLGTATGDGLARVRRGASLSQAVRIIVVADLSMSLDNVLAVAGTAHGDLVLVIAGIALTVPCVVWGSQILSVLMVRFSWLIWVGGGVLGFVAGTMIVEDKDLQQWFGAPLHPHLHPLALLLGALATGYGWFRARAGRRAHG
ncbi:MAG TPA: TerC family protein [Planctomycetota bacterium]|nr:TerC family protein [Planctomycetota bacterium]